MCRRMGVPCTVLAGTVEAEAEAQLYAETGAVSLSIVDGPMSLEEAMRRTEELLERAAARAARSREL
jgi:glycerate kinase